MSERDVIRLIENVSESLQSEVRAGFAEVKTRLDRVDSRLDRIESTLTLHSRQLAAGTRFLAALTEWASKANVDYSRVLAELSDLSRRVEKLEGKQ